MTKPRPARVDAEAWAALAGPPIAHRGLWSDRRPENTLAAFDAAACAGYGLELDVQLSADGKVVVFHDDRLERLTGASGRAADLTAAELGALAVLGSDQTISRLGEALATVDGRSLVVVELKVLGGEEGPLESAVAEALKDYDGPAAILSFNPKTVAWFADQAPGLLRGLNSLAYRDATNWMLPATERTALSELEHVAVARPHFLSLSADMLPSPSAAALRAQGLPIAAWTVRSAAQWARLSRHCDNLMFEGFLPGLAA